MQILQLTKKFPYPPKDGESLLISSFDTVLKSKNIDIDLLSFNTIKHYFDVEKYPVEKNPFRRIETVFLDNRIKIGDAIKNLFSPLPFHISRFISAEYKEKLIKMLLSNEYDLILIESIFLAPYLSVIKSHCSAKTVLRAHNVEYEIWERIIKHTYNLPMRRYLKYLTKKLKKYELSIINDFDMVITLTERDKDIYTVNGMKVKSIVLPAGIESSRYDNAVKTLKGTKEIAFLGSLDWTPNLKGINWFVKKIWKKIIKKYPGAVLHIAGRNTPEQIHKLNNDNITVHGEVPDAVLFLQQYDIMIVPLLSGGGMRLKILEAMALGRIVITTTLGLEGIDAKDTKDVLIADTPEEFVKKITLCFDNPSLLRDISQNAITLFNEKYDMLRISEKFLNSLSSVLSIS